MTAPNPYPALVTLRRRPRPLDLVRTSREMSEKSTPPNPRPRRRTDARRSGHFVERAAPHAPTAVIISVAESTAAPVKRFIANQPMGTPKKAPTKYTLRTTPAAGSERLNRWARVTSNGPKRDEIMPKTMRSSVALVIASGRNATSVEAGSEGFGESGVKGSSRPRASRGRAKVLALNRAFGFVAIQGLLSGFTTGDLGDRYVPP